MPRAPDPGRAPGPVHLPQRPHGLLQHGERGEHVPARPSVLDHVLPPPLGIVIPGGFGERGERITPESLVRTAPGRNLVRSWCRPLARCRLLGRLVRPRGRTARLGGGSLPLPQASVWWLAGR